MEHIQVILGKQQTIDFELDVEGLRDTEITEARMIVKGTTFDKMFKCSQSANDKKHFSVTFEVEELHKGCIEVIAGNYFFEALKFDMVEKVEPKVTVKAKVDKLTESKQEQPKKETETTVTEKVIVQNVVEPTKPVVSPLLPSTNEKIAEVLKSLGLNKKKSRKLINIKH